VRDRLNEITRLVIGAAIKVHRALGPGLLESVYLACLVFELRELGLKLHTQWPVPVVYEDVRLDCGFRVDVIVEDAVILEIKAVEQLAAIHLAQMMTYRPEAG
jgi:GxxExxY protein